MIAFYLILCLVIGFIAQGKTVGFWGGLFLSLILSPIIGLIIVLISKDK